MRKILFVIYITFCIVAFSKSTYVPYYFGRTTITSGKTIVNDSSVSRDFYMESPNGKYSITVLHDSVTEERIKLIKRAKAAEGWGTAAAVLAGMSNMLNPLNNARDIRRYTLANQTIFSSAMLSIISENSVEELTHVDISVIIDNFSDKEMCVNDMSRGLIWFIPSHSAIYLKTGNPEINSFRIATIDNEMVDYATVQAGNFLRKIEIEYENDDFVIFPIIGKTEGVNLEIVYETVGYKKRDKHTLKETVIEYDEGRKLLKQLKRNK